jgi:hypothetical protein
VANTELDTQLRDMVRRYGFMPMLHSLREICEEEMVAKIEADDTRSVFFREFWELASRNLAASELLLLNHVREKKDADS